MTQELSTYYIYTLTNPNNGEVFYVGQTTDTGRRFKQHCLKDEKTRSGRYIKEMGCSPIINTVHTFQAPEMSFDNNCSKVYEIEKRWIRKLSKQGAHLVNIIRDEPKKVSNNYEGIRLTDKALRLINTNRMKILLALAIDCGEFTINKYIKVNHVNLTKAAAIKVIMEECGLNESEILNLSPEITL